MDAENRNTEEARCLNCEATLHKGNFCHICGQPTNTGRLTTKNMGVVALSSLTRINKHFLHTVKWLLIRPWRVIADYIKGKRVAYTAPVQLLIVLSFLLVAINPFVGNDVGLAEDYGDVSLLVGEGWLTNGLNAAFKTVASSLTLTFLLMLIPAVPILQLTHRIAGIKRYNLAEYIVGALYVSCFILAIDLVSIPLDVVCNLCFSEDSVFSELVELAKGCFALTVLSMTLYRSLSSSGKGRLAKVSLILLFFLLCFLFYLLLVRVLYAIHIVSRMIAEGHT